MKIKIIIISAVIIIIAAFLIMSDYNQKKARSLLYAKEYLKSYEATPTIAEVYEIDGFRYKNIKAYQQEEDEAPEMQYMPLIDVKMQGQNQAVKIIGENISEINNSRDNVCYASPAVWKIREVYDWKNNTENACLLVGVDIRELDNDEPGGAGVFVFNYGLPKKLLQVIPTECYYEKIEAYDLTGDGKKELVLRGGNGMHAKSTSVYGYDGEKFNLLLEFESYRYYPQVFKIAGVDKIVDYEESQIYHNEPDRVVRPVIYTWNGKEFILSKNELVEIVNKYLNKDEIKNWKEVLLKKLEEYSVINPDDEDAYYNAMCLAKELKLSVKYKELRKKYIKAAEKVNKCEICPDGDWANRLDALNNVKNEPLE